jgi:hypothetical protein
VEAIREGREQRCFCVFLVLTAAFLQAQGRVQVRRAPHRQWNILLCTARHWKAILKGILRITASPSIFPQLSYGSDRRYPVVYLAGYGAHDDMFTGRLGNLTERGPSRVGGWL